MNYKCKMCDTKLDSSWTEGHVAKHFQDQKFTKKYLRTHFEEFFVKEVIVQTTL